MTVRRRNWWPSTSTLVKAIPPESTATCSPLPFAEPQAMEVAAAAAPAARIRWPLFRAVLGALLLLLLAESVLAWRFGGAAG